MTIIDSPAIKKRSSVSIIMFTVILTLIPALLIQIGFFGYQILGNLFFGISFALILESICLYLQKKPIKLFLNDFSAFLTAWLLVISMPSTSPWWLIAIGIFFSIVVAKHAYGGLGSNPFNPAMIGYAVLLISFPKLMTSWPESNSINLNNFLEISTIIVSQPFNYVADAVASATPLDTIKTTLFLGNTIDKNITSFNSSSYQLISLFYLLGGFYLIFKKVISWHLPISFIGGVFVFSMILFLIDPTNFMNPIFHIINGATLLGAFYIITDPVSSPTTIKGKIIFGILVGLITVIVRNFGGYPDGVAFAVIFMNICVPLIEKFSQPKVFGYE